jgi:hypothetical protein
MPSSFAITVTSSTLKLGTERTGAISITVTNTTNRALRGRAQIEADPTAQPWLTLLGEAERSFAAGLTQQYVVNVGVPASAPASSTTMRLNMIGVENPDEDFTRGPTVTIEVPAAPVPVKRPFPWWIVAVVVVILVIIGSISGWLLSRQQPVADEPTAIVPTIVPTIPPAPVATVPAIITPDPNGDPNIFSTNSSFEQEPNSTGIGWFPDKLELAKYATWSGAFARTGTRSLSISAATFPQDKGGWPGWFTTKKIPIENGQTYTFSVWAKSPNGASTWIAVNMYDADGNFLIGYSTGCSPIQDPSTWQQIQLSISNSDSRASRATQVQLGLQQCQSEGEMQRTLYYDDVFFGLKSP